VDAQIAPVLGIAARHGVACPTIARLVAMIHECEGGTRPASDDNLLELMKS
jgi:2-dehydropantoate 2-reductase